MEERMRYLISMLAALVMLLHPGMVLAATTSSDGVTLEATRQGPWVSTNQFMRPSPGNQFYAVEVVLKNPGANSADFNLFSFSLATSDGGRYTPTFFGPEPTLSHGTLFPNDAVRGWVTFEVPTGSKVTRLIWAPNIFGEAYQIPL
jgi:hypothetical protein